MTNRNEQVELEQEVYEYDETMEDVVLERMSRLEVKKLLESDSE